MSLKKRPYCHFHVRNTVPMDNIIFRRPTNTLATRESGTGELYFLVTVENVCKRTTVVVGERKKIREKIENILDYLLVVKKPKPLRNGLRN